MNYKTIWWLLPFVLATVLVLPQVVPGQTPQSATHLEKVYSIVLQTIEKMKNEGVTAENAHLKNVRQQYGSTVNRFDGRGRIGLLLDVKGVSQNLIARLQALGGAIDLSLPQAKLISVYMPIDKVEDVAMLDEVKIVRPMVGGSTNTGSKTTEGDSIHHAINVRSDLNVLGDSINVGVISDGCVSWPASQSGGDLPAGFGPPSYTYGGLSREGWGDEGTAMMEIVHDLAPNATLFFYGALYDTTGIHLSSAAMIDAIYRLVREKHCKIIVDDLTWYDQPMFEDCDAATAGYVAAAAKWAIDTGVVYISSAGNFGGDGSWGHAHFQQVYNDPNPQNNIVKPIPPPYSQMGNSQPLPIMPGVMNAPPYADLHYYSTSPVDDPALAVVVPGHAPGQETTTLTVILEWNDPWGASTSDYDLYLYSGDFIRQLARSISPQNGGQNPIETVTWENYGAVDSTVQVVINLVEAPRVHSPKLLGMYLFGVDSVEYHTPENSIWGQPGVPLVIATGAVPYNNISTIEGFSSHGNYDVYFPAHVSRPKPDVVAIDNGVITGVGPFGNWDPVSHNWRFLGTSAAAPQVAGMAALLLSKFPKLTPPQVHAKFERTAVVLGDQTIYGSGRADIERAMLEVDTSVIVSGPYTMGSTLNVPAFFGTDSGFAVNNVKITGGTPRPTQVSSSVTVTAGSPYTSAGVVDLGCPSVKRWYQLTQTGGTNGQFNAQVTAYVAESERAASGVAANNLRLLHWNGSYFDILPQAMAPVQVANTWKVVASFNNASFSPFFVGYLTRGVDASTVSNNTGCHDSTVTVAFSVGNTGNGWDTLRFSVHDNLDWTIAPGDSALSVAAGQQATITVHVTIPHGDPVGTIDSLRLTLWSVSDPTYRDSSYATVEITTSVVTVVSTLKDGWNMVSVPATVADCRRTSVFPKSTSSAFSYVHGYAIKDTLQYGSGYWLKFHGPLDDSITGTVRVRDTFTLADKWNMIGSISSPVDIDSIVQLPGGIVASHYFGYNNGYSIADTIRPGLGYWVKTNGGGQLVLKKSGAVLAPRKLSEEGRVLQGINSAMVSDAGGGASTLYFGKTETVGSMLSRCELPPLPPPASFDARFASQRFVEGYTAGSTPSRLDIDVQSESFPLTLTWKVADNDARFWLVVGENSRQPLTGTGGSTVIQSPVKRLAIEVQSSREVLIPKEFALGQNYPNPFNPTTVISYQLPVASYVMLKVYNMLGQEVAMLINGMQEAGYKSVELDASNMPSGLYIYRLTAGTYTAVRKMLMIK
ncbi:MAG: S8/S53 family peptidase [Bacteroidota bacterium]|jgi:hypothetical protein